MIESLAIFCLPFRRGSGSYQSGRLNENYSVSREYCDSQSRGPGDDSDSHQTNFDSGAMLLSTRCAFSDRVGKLSTRCAFSDRVESLSTRCAFSDRGGSLSTRCAFSDRVGCPTHLAVSTVVLAAGRTPNKNSSSC